MTSSVLSKTFLWTKHSARKNSSLIFKQGKSRKHKKDLEMCSDFVIQVICYTSELEYCFDKISALKYKKFMEKSSSVPLHIIFLMLLLPHPEKKWESLNIPGSSVPRAPPAPRISVENWRQRAAHDVFSTRWYLKMNLTITLLLCERFLHVVFLTPSKPRSKLISFLWIQWLILLSIASSLSTYKPRLCCKRFVQTKDSFKDHRKYIGHESGLSLQVLETSRKVLLKPSVSPRPNRAH